MEKSRQLVCAVVYRKRFPHFKLKAGKHEPAFNLMSINTPQFYNESISRYGCIHALGDASAHVHAAIHRNRGPGNIGSTIRSQKSDDLGNFFRLSETTQRNLSQ